MHRKALRTFTSSLAVLIMATGCTPSSDPLVERVTGANLGSLTIIDPEVKGYCQPMELFCRGPLFEPAFTAPADADPIEVCNAVVSLQAELGLVAYAATGGEAGVAENRHLVTDFCTAGLSQAIQIEDGSVVYEGTTLFDDGAADGMGKVTTIGREPDGTYYVVFSMSRNLDRVGWISYGASQPTHMAP